ncbi:glycosyltransferase family 39 protein [Paenibacillus albiflavus]|uniref:glycosyltransferase family 39 protein n=1 Tax=Paenibacillus albiflavus TaxID=2545760 RepID=UPI0014048AF4|nr:glycosyltransferase family 39 protein [Paenibacillus albiflavus]
MKRNNILFKSAIILLLLIGLLLRCYFTEWNKPLTGDEVGYNKMVYQLLDKGIYGYTPYGTSITPNAFTTPGYPIFLAICYSIFGYHNGNPPIMQIQLFQILIQLICSLLLYLIATKLFSRRIVGLLVMACYLLHPTFILSSSYILTETLYGLFNLLFIFLLIHSINKKNKTILFLLGFTFGVCILIRPAILPFLFILIFYFFIREKDKKLKYKLMDSVFLIIGFFVTMLPWWIRNVISLDKIVLLAEQAGNPLLWGAYPNNPFPDIDPLMKPEDMGKIAINRIINGFKNEPFTYLEWYTWGKLRYLVEDIFPGTSYITKDYFRSIHIISVILGVIGLIFMTIKRNLSSGLILFMFFLTNILVYLPFAPVSRYFYSALPLCLIGLGQLFYFLVTFRIDLNKTSSVNKNPRL